MPYSVKGFFEINEDMVQILLMLEVLFTQNSKVEDLFCGASSGSEPSLFFSNYFFSLGFQPIQDDFQHDFARMTDEADSSVVLAEPHCAQNSQNSIERKPKFQHNYPPFFTTGSCFGSSLTSVTFVGAATVSSGVGGASDGVRGL